MDRNKPYISPTIVEETVMTESGFAVSATDYEDGGEFTPTGMYEQL